MLNVTVNIHFDASKRQSEPPVFSHPYPPPQPSSLLSPSRPSLVSTPALVPFVPVAAVFGRLPSPRPFCPRRGHVWPPFLPLTRQIQPPLSALVAICRECRYLSPKKHEKHLDASKNPPTFAPSKQNDKTIIN